MQDPTLDRDQLIATVRDIGQELVDSMLAFRAPDQWQDDASSYASLDPVISRALQRLTNLQIWGPQNRLPSNEFWDVAGDLLKHGNLLLHARIKPRGYAGDFEMLEKICFERICDHPLGKLLDRYFQNQHAPQAVRNRTKIVAERIVAGCRTRGASPYHIVSIGSGPAIDVRWACEALDREQRQQLHATLIDLDPYALEHAEQHLRPWLPGTRLTISRQNLYRLWRCKHLPAPAATADFIFCTGLFDYLTDADAARLLRTLWQWLSPGGKLLVFNFSPINPTRAYMEWTGNWYLTYRSEQQMHQLAALAGFREGQYNVAAEPLGVNLCLEVPKTGFAKNQLDVSTQSTERL